MYNYVLLLSIFLTLQTCGSPPADHSQAGANSEAAPPEAQSSSAEVVEVPRTNMLTEQMVADGWTVLFNGKDLNAWRGYTMDSTPKGWSATNDEILFTPGDGNGGDLVTREQFTDFELQLDYQLIEGGNSGIFYLVNEVEGMPIYFNAPEFQLLDDDWWAAEQDEQAVHFTSANYDLQAPAGAEPNPIGQWNTAKIIKRGDTVQHFLNGKLTVEYVLGSPEWTAQYEASKFIDFEGATYGQARTGNLGLQDHGEVVRFRNVFVKKL